MPAIAKVHSLVAALANGVHNLSTASIKVALCAAANPPLVSHTRLSDLTEIAYTNLSSRAVATVSSAQVGLDPL